jgi:hypothetical protein
MSSARLHGSSACATFSESEGSSTATNSASSTEDLVQFRKPARVGEGVCEDAAQSSLVLRLRLSAELVALLVRLEDRLVGRV